MPNDIYRTVSFRRPKLATVGVPVGAVHPAAEAADTPKKARDETGQTLAKFIERGWRRPSNDDLLAYLSSKFPAKPDEGFTADRSAAIAIALLKRPDQSFDRQIHAEAERYLGAKLLPTGRDTSGIVGDLLQTLNRGAPDGIHGDRYLNALKQLASEWDKRSPQGHADLDADLQERIGSVSLLKRGSGGNARDEFRTMDVSPLFRAPKQVAQGRFDSFLGALRHTGMPAESARIALIGGMRSALQLLDDEGARRDPATSESAPARGSAWSWRSSAENEPVTATRRLVPRHRNFRSLAEAALKRWASIAPEGLENLLETMIGRIDETTTVDSVNVRNNAALTNLAAKSSTLGYTASQRPCVASFGVGDLYVVEEEWLGNVPREISYIENARGGEDRLRIHEQETEQVTYQENEIITEESKTDSHQTADRFEIQSTVASQTSMQLGINASVNVSGQFGTASVQTSVGVTFGMSRTDSAATTVAKARETISKATSEIRNNVREKLTKTLRERTMSRNEHRFASPVDNSSVFLFVEKKYRVQVRQFGARLFLEFIVPEPGRTLLGRKAATHGLEPFTLRPDDIEYDNTLKRAGIATNETLPVGANHFTALQAKYDARGVVPPPRRMTVDVGMIFDIQDSYGAAKEVIKVPEGYRAYDYDLSVCLPMGGQARIAVNGKGLLVYPFPADPASEFYEWGDDSGPPTETGFVMIGAMKTAPGKSGKFKGFANLALNICPTNDVLHKWRMETWLRLRDGYLSQLAEGEARLERAMSGVSREDPPTRLRDMERAELQRAILCLMTGKSPDYSMVRVNDEIPSDVYEFYEPKGCQARLRTMVSFFDAAFEWQDMLTFYMPYVLGEQVAWTPRMNLKTVDEKHRQFLAAGAARVMLPVAPGHEAKVLQFISMPIGEQVHFFTQLLIDNDDAAFAGALPDYSSNLLREILCERNDRYRIGAGKLEINGKDFIVVADASFPQLAWTLDDRLDIGREVLIDGKQYVVETVTSSSTGTFRTDTGAVAQHVDYYLGSVPIGDSWIEYVPTPLIILGGQEYKLGAVAGTEVQCPPLEAESAEAETLESATSSMEAATESADPVKVEAAVKALPSITKLEDAFRKRLEESRKKIDATAKKLEGRSDERQKKLAAIDKAIKEQKEKNAQASKA